MPELCKVVFLINREAREVAAAGGAPAVLMEDGVSYVLKEDGSRILLE